MCAIRGLSDHVGAHDVRDEGLPHRRLVGFSRTSCAPTSAVRGPPGRGAFVFYTTTTGILPIFERHSFGPVSCTEVPALSTATVTGMSLTSNS